MKTNSPKKNIVPITVFIGLMILTIVISVIVRNNVESKSSLQFNNQSSQITSLIKQRIDLYSNVVYGIEGLFAASDTVNDDEWHAYVRQLNLQKNYSGITAILFAQRVTEEERADYPYKIFPDTNKEEYFPVTYVATPTEVSTTSTVFGFDASSEAVRKEAMDVSESSNTPAASGVFLTVSTNAPSFSIFTPIYKNNLSPTTSAEKHESLEGFAYVNFRLDNFFGGISSDPVFDKNIDLEIVDATAWSKVSSSTKIYDKDPSTSIVSSTGNSLIYTTNIDVAGRQWVLSFKTQPGYSTGRLNEAAPYLSFFIGTLFSFLMAGLIYSYSTAQARATNLADKMTLNLKESEEKYRAIFESLQDVFYRTDLNGVIKIVSPSIEKYTGVAPEKLIGRNAIEFYPNKEEREKMIGLLMKNGSVSDFPISLFGKNHTTIDVSVNARVVFDSSNNPIGIEGVLRDVSERRKAENELRQKSEELERLNSMMIGRELKMIEMKKQLGQKDDK